MKAGGALLVSLSCLAVLGSGAPAVAQSNAPVEVVSMKKSSDRNAPKQVPAVELGGVRYEQVMNARSLGFEGDTGYLRAVRVATGEELWVRRVYANEIDPTKERDVQLRYFSDMTVSPDGDRILITNEAGERWSVDPETGASEPLP